MNRVLSTSVYAILVLGVLTWMWVDADSYGLMDGSHGATLSRQKRYLPLVFPDGGISKLLIGIAVPIKNPANISLIFALNFQCQYNVPPNITFFSKYYPYVVVSRKKRSEVPMLDPSREFFYKAVENTMDGYGIDGRNCLLRTICEAAERPIGQENGLIGELLHLLLTPKDPDISLDGNSLGISRMAATPYHAARQAGERLYDCRKLYPECPIGDGLFDHISSQELY